MSVPVHYRAPSPKPNDTKIEVVDTPDELRISIPPLNSEYPSRLAMLGALAFLPVALFWTVMSLVGFAFEGAPLADVGFLLICAVPTWCIVAYGVAKARHVPIDASEIIVSPTAIVLTRRHGASSKSTRIDLTRVRSVKQSLFPVWVAGETRPSIVQVRHTKGTLRAPVSTLDEAEWIVTLLLERFGRCS